jgi:hypothetical protein
MWCCRSLPRLDKEEEFRTISSVTSFGVDGVMVSKTAGSLLGFVVDNHMGGEGAGAGAGCAAPGGGSASAGTAAASAASRTAAAPAPAQAPVVVVEEPDDDEDEYADMASFRDDNLVVADVVRGLGVCVREYVCVRACACVCVRVAKRRGRLWATIRCWP